MLVHNVVQGSAEWFAVRCGIPTASEFHKILTPTGKISTQAKGYMNQLLAELITGEPIKDLSEDGFEGNYWTDRGHELEGDAADYYELKNGVDTVKVGFVTNDAKTMGASPDRLVGQDGLLEIKCLGPHTHVGHLLEPKVDQKYNPQLQGQLLVTDRKWVDIIAYHPKMPAVVIRVMRDEAYIGELNRLLNEFNHELLQQKNTLTARGLMGKK